jgi:hypothetical protein
MKVRFVVILANSIIPYLYAAYFLYRKDQHALVSIIGRKLTLSLGIIGVPLHEMGHLIFCVLMGHKIVGVKFYSPSVDGTLGYVNHSYRKTWFSPFALLIIGLAPLASGVFGMYIVTSIIRPDLLTLLNEYNFVVTDLNSGFIALKFIMGTVLSGEFLGTVVWATLIFSITLFMSPSKADFQSCKSAVLVLLAMFVAFAVIFPNKIKYLSDYLHTVLFTFAWPLYITLAILIIMTGLILCVKICFHKKSNNQYIED